MDGKTHRWYHALIKKDLDWQNEEREDSLGSRVGTFSNEKELKDALTGNGS